MTTIYLLKIAPNITVWATPITHHSYVNVCTLNNIYQPIQRKMSAVKMVETKNPKEKVYGSENIFLQRTQTSRKDKSTDHCHCSKVCSSNKNAPSANKRIIHKFPCSGQGLVSHKKSHFCIHSCWAQVIAAF